MGYDYSILFDNEKSKIGINKFGFNGDQRPMASILVHDDILGELEAHAFMNKEELYYLFLCLKDCFEHPDSPAKYNITDEQLEIMKKAIHVNLKT